MQTTGATLLAAKQPSLLYMWTSVHDGRSAQGFLYLVAVRDDCRQQEHRQGRVDNDPVGIPRQAVSRSACPAFRPGAHRRRSTGSATRKRPEKRPERTIPHRGCSLALCETEGGEGGANPLCGHSAGRNRAAPVRREDRKIGASFPWTAAIKTLPAKAMV